MYEVVQLLSASDLKAEVYLIVDGTVGMLAVTLPIANSCNNNVLNNGKNCFVLTDCDVLVVGPWQPHLTGWLFTLRIWHSFKIPLNIITAR